MIEKASGTDAQPGSDRRRSGGLGAATNEQRKRMYRRAFCFRFPVCGHRDIACRRVGGRKQHIDEKAFHNGKSDRKALILQRFNLMVIEKNDEK